VWWQFIIGGIDYERRNGGSGKNFEYEQSDKVLLFCLRFLSEKMKWLKVGL
jgi:hypothetical protein